MPEPTRDRTSRNYEFLFRLRSFRITNRPDQDRRPCPQELQARRQSERWLRMGGPGRRARSLGPRLAGIRRASGVSIRRCPVTRTSRCGRRQLVRQMLLPTHRGGRSRPGPCSREAGTTGQVAIGLGGWCFVPHRILGHRPGGRFHRIKNCHGRQALDPLPLHPSAKYRLGARRRTPNPNRRKPLAALKAGAFEEGHGVALWDRVAAEKPPGALLDETGPYEPATAWKFVYQELLLFHGSIGLSPPLRGGQGPTRPLSWYDRIVRYRRDQASGTLHTSIARCSGRSSTACSGTVWKTAEGQGGGEAEGKALELEELEESEGGEGMGDVEAYVPDSDLVAEFSKRFRRKPNSMMPRLSCSQETWSRRPGTYLHRPTGATDILGEGSRICFPTRQ